MVRYILEWQGKESPAKEDISSDQGQDDIE